ncbi:hypothetical protein SISNIDRAFT_482867, partial [Sistotremastrum niveocremeum HHB9708]
ESTPPRAPSDAAERVFGFFPNSDVQNSVTQESTPPRAPSDAAERIFGSLPNSDVEGSITQESTPARAPSNVARRLFRSLPDSDVQDSRYEASTSPNRGSTHDNPISLGSSDSNDEESVLSRTPSRCPSDPQHPGWKRILAHENQAGLHPRVLAQMYHHTYVSPPRPESIGPHLEELLHLGPSYIEEDYDTPIKDNQLRLPIDDIPLPQEPAPDPYPPQSDPIGHQPKYIKLKNKLAHQGFGRVRSRASAGLLFPLAVRKALVRRSLPAGSLQTRWGVQNDSANLHAEIFEEGRIPMNISDHILVLGTSCLVGELPIHYGIEKCIRGASPSHLVFIRRIENRDGKAHCADRFVDAWDWRRAGDDLVLEWRGESASPIIVYPPWDISGNQPKPFWYPVEDFASKYLVQLVPRAETYLGLRELLGDQPYSKEYAALRAWLQNRHASWAPFFVQAAVNHKYLLVMESNEYKHQARLEMEREGSRHEVMHETPRHIRVLDFLESNDVCAQAARAACASPTDTALEEIRLRALLNHESAWYRRSLGIGQIRKRY